MKPRLPPFGGGGPSSVGEGLGGVTVGVAVGVAVGVVGAGVGNELRVGVGEPVGSGWMQLLTALLNAHP
jgi:hypothetical protein